MRTWQIRLRNMYWLREGVIFVNRAAWRYPRNLIKEFAENPTTR